MFDTQTGPRRQFIACAKQGTHKKAKFGQTPYFIEVCAVVRRESWPDIRKMSVLSVKVRSPHKVGNVLPIGHFTTQRLSVCNWRPIVDGKRDRQMIETTLTTILTPNVLKHLPQSLHLGRGGISSWVDERIQESDVLLVKHTGSGELVGLMILASEPRAGNTLNLHIGYLLAESTWGQGIATELVTGFVLAMEDHKPVKLFGGVDTGNPASARVLQKAGFLIDPNLSKHDIDIYIRTME